MIRSYYYQALPVTPASIGAPWCRLQTAGADANLVTESNSGISSIELGTAGQLLPTGIAPVREATPELNNAQVIVCGPNSGLQTTQLVPAGLLGAHERAIYLLLKLDGVAGRRAFFGYGTADRYTMVDLMTNNGSLIGVHRYFTGIDAQAGFAPGQWQLVRLLLKDGTARIKVNQQDTTAALLFNSQASPLRLGVGGSPFWDSDGTVRLAHAEVYEHCPNPAEELVIEQRILALYQLAPN